MFGQLPEIGGLQSGTEALPAVVAKDQRIVLVDIVRIRARHVDQRVAGRLPVQRLRHGDQSQVVLVGPLLVAA